MADSAFIPGEVSADLDKLEKLFKRLSAEYELFLSQATRWPPNQRLAEVEAIVRHYSKHHPRRTVDRFRFNTLVHRLRTSLERWHRRQRRLEEEGTRARLDPGVGRTQDAADPSRPQVLASLRVTGGRASGDQMRDLYLAYKNARRARGLAVSSLSYAPFADRVGATIDAARAKNPERDIELRLDEVGGKVRIGVRAVSSGESS